jgi:2-iminobutanoate/2-iminopropanoate deaminase
LIPNFAKRVPRSNAKFGIGALADEQGKSMAGDFEGQARVIFRAIDGVVKRAGGGLKDVVTITVYLTDPRLIDPLMPIRREFFPTAISPPAPRSRCTACPRSA